MEEEKAHMKEDIPDEREENVEMTPSQGEEATASTAPQIKEATEEAKAEEPQGPLVNEEMLKELMEMGFPQNRAIRALYYGSGTLDRALTWIEEHEKDPDINDPLPADAKPPPPKVLTAEEKAAKAEELKRRIAENRRIQSEQEKIDEKRREKERIQAGKELAESRKVLEEQERKRMIELRKKEKAEETAERERLRQLLREDRVRRFGVEKANELEEKDRQKAEAFAKKKAEKSEAERKRKEEEDNAIKTIGGAAGGTQHFDLDKSIKLLKVSLEQIESNARVPRKVCLETLRLYVGNVVDHPSEPKYRKIRTANAAFQKRVASADGGVEFLNAIGFSSAIESDFLVLTHNDMFFLNRARGDLELHLSSMQ